MKNYYPLNYFAASFFRRAAFFHLIVACLLSAGAGLCFAAPGDLDTGFGTNGIAITPVGSGTDTAQAAVLQPDGKIIVAGSAQNDFALVRYNANGSLDTGFGTSGKVITPVTASSDEAFAVALQPDGKIVAAGKGFADFAVVRYNSNGSLDTTFGTGGIVITAAAPGFDYAEAVVIQPDGKIVAVGWRDSDKFILVRYNQDGSLDTTFGTGGIVTTQFNIFGLAHAAVLQSDGKIVVAGETGVDFGQSTFASFSLVRYLADGSLDATFGMGGVAVTIINNDNQSRAYDLALQPDGKIVASGSYESAANTDTLVARYNPNGSLDTSFGNAGLVITRVGAFSSLGETVSLQANGKIVVAGTSYNGVASVGFDYGLLRLNANGSLDTTFGSGGKVLTTVRTGNDFARDSLIQPDGKIVIAGFSQDPAAGSQADFAIVRYLGDATSVLRAPFDFDGDNKTDISIFRPSAGEWWINRSATAQTVAAQFGQGSDKPVPADFTGDGRADIAFFRPSTGEWFILRSEDASFLSFPFGTNGDVPVVGDFDADGKADPTVFRPSTNEWFILKSSGGVSITTFGVSGDVPVAADFDGDAKTDIAIYRPSVGQWWIQRSSNNSVYAFQFGLATDKPAQGDYTGDGKADAAFFRPSTGEWFFLRSEDSSFYSVPFGAMGDVPVLGDFDGDGKFDTAVFRPSNTTWFINRTTAGILITTFGIAGDKPLPNVFVP